MTEGVASDFSDSEAVMDDPEATFAINLGRLPPQQALMLVQTAGRLDDYNNKRVGKAMKGKEDAFEYETLDFHFTTGEALTLLQECGAIEMPEEEEVEVDIEDE